MIYAIGDIHGHLDKLVSLIGEIKKEGLAEEDRLVFLGDYVDRGPKIPELLDFLVHLQSVRPNTIFLRGNHDQVMIDARNVFRKSPTDATLQDIHWWFSYGGRETIDSYPEAEGWYNRIPDDHWAFLESTTLEYREGGYIFVHAGLLPPGMKWSQREDARMWIREPFIGSMADFGGTVVFGHTPQHLFMPCVMRNKVGIDTGAAYGGQLTALKIDPSKPYDSNRLRFLTS